MSTPTMPDESSSPREGARRLHLPSTLRRAELLARWGRDANSATERVEGVRAGFAVAAPNGPIGLVLDLSASDAVDIRWSWARTVASAPEPSAIERIARRLLGLHIDPAEFEAQARRIGHGRLVEGREGLTPPLEPTLWDALVWVVVGQQVSLPVAFLQRRRLAGEHGESVELELGAGETTRLSTVPGPAVVARLDAEQLRACGLSRRKAEYLGDMARALVSGDFDLEALASSPRQQRREALLARRGLGPWSVGYLDLRAFGDPDAVPLGDAGLRRALRRYFDLDEAPSRDRVAELLTPFAPWRSLATFHFWAGFA
ncbi:MAG: hypothetical protein AAGN46_14665 [Acidobacteriota bacterium]